MRFIGPDVPTRRPRLRPTEAARTHAALRLLATGDERIVPPLHRIGPSPKRSRMLTAAGLGVVGAAPAAESTIYDELRRRFRDAGPGWRDTELPWTPSFLPFVLKRTARYREGPDVLLLRAKELCETKAIERYRKLREALVAADAHGSADARTEEPTCPFVARSGRARNIPAGDALDALGVHRSLPAATYKIP